MKENKSLYQLDEMMRQLLEEGVAYNEETGEVFYTYDEIDQLELAIDNKIDSLIGYIKEKEIEAANLKAIKDEYAKRQKQKENRIASLKNYLSSFLSRNNINKKETNNGLVSFRKSVSSEITDISALKEYIEKNKLEDKYYSYKEPEISKKALADEIKKSKNEDGTYNLNIPGFALVEKNNIQVK